MGQSQVRAGQPVSFTVDAHPGAVFAGKVATVRRNTVTMRNAVTYTVVVGISGATEKLLPYLTAHLEFE